MSAGRFNHLTPRERRAQTDARFDRAEQERDMLTVVVGIVCLIVGFYAGAKAGANAARDIAALEADAKNVAKKL